MGTSCVVRFIEEDEPLCAIYKHYDGDDFKRELTDYLEKFKVVNDIPLKYEGAIANGVGDLAAQVVANFKDGPGDVYMCSTEDEGDYTYEVYCQGDRVFAKTI